MKEFNLEAAKNGAPIQTRDGRKARIICFDFKDPVRPLIVLVEEPDTLDCNKIQERLYTYALNGHYDPNKSGLDLMLATKHYTGWVNIYKEDNGDGHNTYGVYEEEQDALSDAKIDGTVATVKIEWEE